jgi:PAS domain S-box-containing protein
VKSNVLTWSKEQCLLFGLQQDEFTGKVEDFKRYVLPEDLERMYQEGEFAGEQASDYEYEFRIRRKDGAIRWLQARSRTVYSQQGQLIYITGVNIDITEQKLSEERLRQSEQRFSAAVAAVQGILWTNNAIGQMEGPQPGWTSLTGQTFEEYQGYGWASAVHPDDAQPTVDAWNEAVREQRTFVFEHRLKRKDGTWGRFSIRAIPVKQPDGTIREWVGVHTDITDQRTAEESLLESEKRFRTLAETLPQLVWMTDANGNREFASHQWVAYSGLDPKDETTFVQMVHPADLSPLMNIWQHCLQTGELYRAEARLKNRAGDYRWHFVQGEPLHNEKGRLCAGLAPLPTYTTRKHCRHNLKSW